MLEQVLELLKTKEVYYDTRMNEFVSKKDPFVAPECYVDKQDIIDNYETFLKAITDYYTQLKEL